MNRLIFSLIAFVFLNNCSFNENSKIWQDKEKKFKSDKNVQKLFADKKHEVSEFNQKLKLDLSKIKTNNYTTNNQNNFGSQSYEGKFNKTSKYKFAKLDEINQLNFKPVFLKDGIIFFDKKGSIIKFNKNGKVIWKKNYYSKSEKKLKPKLNFLLKGQKLLIVDSIAKYYSINVISGELNWMKNNNYPFNSDIKRYKDKIFVVDFKNTLRCYKIIDGSECWNLQTEISFTISNAKYSLIILNDKVVFSNSIGDITAVDIETGLIIWQLPTQSNTIINETYNFKISKLVSDGNSLFFSNNKSEFYSIDVKTGAINWINKINSYIKSILVENLLFTISDEGFLYVIDKNKGNIIRISDVFKSYKRKDRNDIYPVGFVIGNANLYITVSDGKLIKINLENGEITKIEKISGNLVSEPFIFNNSLFVIRNGSILKYN